MATLNGVGRTAVDPGDFATFGSPPKYMLIRGPAKLYRFGKPNGKWWFNPELFSTLREDFYEEVYGDGPRTKNDDGTRYVRHALAVSREWNKFAKVSMLTLKAGDDIDCFVGPTAEQPEWQNKQDGPILRGGMLQYVIYEIGMVPSQNFRETTMMALYSKWS